MTEMISSYNLLLRERDDLRQALARLHAWVLAEQDDFVCSAEHPIAQAAAALASHGVVASAAAHPDHWICAMAKALNALEHAQCGLRWYRDRCPEAVDGSDDEADEMIDAAVAGLKLALNRNAGVEVCPECGPVTKCHGVGPGTECPHGVPASPRRLRRDEVIALISPLSNNSADHDIEFAQRVMDACGMTATDALSPEECALLDRILEGFADCGETEEGHDVLLEFARRGYLECERYAPTDKAHQALAAWRAAGVALPDGSSNA